VAVRPIWTTCSPWASRGTPRSIDGAGKLGAPVEGVGGAVAVEADPPAARLTTRIADTARRTTMARRPAMPVRVPDSPSSRHLPRYMVRDRTTEVKVGRRQEWLDTRGLEPADPGCRIVAIGSGGPNTHDG
jgi:hypothetical protein